MIGSGIIEGKAQELFERYSVVDLSFQLRVGIDAEPLLEEQAFHKDNRWVSFVSFSAFADGICSHEEAFDSGPIHDGTDLFHSCDSPVFSMEEKREISAKVKLFFIFLKPIDPPKLII
jgi:hypothetical protein